MSRCMLYEQKKATEKMLYAHGDDPRFCFIDGLSAMTEEDENAIVTKTHCLPL